MYHDPFSSITCLALSTSWAPVTASIFNGEYSIINCTRGSVGKLINTLGSSSPANAGSFKSISSWSINFWAAVRFWFWIVALICKKSVSGGGIEYKSVKRSSSVYIG